LIERHLQVAKVGGRVSDRRSRFERLTQLKPPALPEDIYTYRCKTIHLTEATMNTIKMLQTQNSPAPVMLVAMELSLKKWRLAMAPTGAVKRRVREVEGGNYVALLSVLKDTLKHFKLSARTSVIFCYEAGRDGFYPFRRLHETGHTVWVVDSSSIEVNRRQRRAKNDSIDADKLLALMQRKYRGESEALRCVHVPSAAEEDERQLTRERDELRQEKARLSTRMQSLVFAQGWREWPHALARITTWLQQHGEQLGEHLRARLHREHTRLQTVDAQLKAVDKQLKENRRCATAQSSRIAYTAQRLGQLKGIADIGAGFLSSELFGWRHFNNRREVGSSAGLTPTPYDSGGSAREQGISKAGNKRVRRVIIELAWKWLQHQPDSALSQWFEARFGGNGKRSRRLGIVALARKLLVALWHYLEHGVVPAGAQLKA
jgi:transposase